MRRFAVLFLGITLVIASAPAVGAGNAKEKPFHAEMHGYLIGFNTDADLIADRCDNPENTWAVTSFDGWGDFSHLGYSYGYAEHCSYIDPPLSYGEGELTVTAANGDILNARYEDGSSLIMPEPFIGFEDTFMFVDGGTGRFAFAGGGGTESGIVNFANGEFSVWMTGTISYSK